jgi:Ion channel
MAMSGVLGSVPMSIGTIDYTLKPNIDLHAGVLSYGGPAAHFKAHMYAQSSPQPSASEGAGLSPKLNMETDKDLAEIVVGHGRCSYLLVSLFLLLFIYPYCIDEGAIEKIIVSIIFSTILITGSYATGHNRGSLVLGVTLAIVAITLQWLHLVGMHPIMFRVLSLIYIIFLTYTIGAVLHYLLVKGPVTADKLHGALAGFIMLAFLWAFLYTLLEDIFPHSFSIGNGDTDKGNLFYLFLYFSFTTLTTVGFGDIAPITHQARSLVIIEQLIGVFFVAVLIARLAGLYPPRAE